MDIVFDTNPHISASIDSSDSRHDNNRARTHAHTHLGLFLSVALLLCRKVEGEIRGAERNPYGRTAKNADAGESQAT